MPTHSVPNMTADPTPCVVVYPGLFDRRPRNHLYYRDSNLDHEAGVVRRKGVVRDGLPDALEADPPLHRRGSDCLRRDLLHCLRIAADTGWKRRGGIRRGVTEQSVRCQTALASIKHIQSSAVLDLTEDYFEFLTSNKVWLATHRARARR